MVAELLIRVGEAIVRGILPAPKYVTTVFKYQQDLARYQSRVDNLRSPGIQDVNQKYLDALKRALEQADGLDKVFARHITNKSGKCEISIETLCRFIWCVLQFQHQLP